MEEKTIGYLNSKAWYRFIKVLFGVGLLSVLVIFNVCVFRKGISKLEADKTIIQCTLGAKRSFSAESLNLRNSDFIAEQFDYKRFYEESNGNNLENILKKCYPKKPILAEGDIYNFQKIAELLNKYGVTDYSKVSPDGTVDYLNALTNDKQEAFKADYDAYLQQTKGIVGREKLAFLDFNFKMFDVKPAFTKKIFLLFFLIGNFTISLVFEISKRIFYYIILGSLKPKK